MNYSQAKIKERRKDIAFLYYYLRWTIEEIVVFSGYCKRTVQRDIEYIEAHPDEFFG